VTATNEKGKKRISNALAQVTATSLIPKTGVVMEEWRAVFA
jgi:hypothetical protein